MTIWTLLGKNRAESSHIKLILFTIRSEGLPMSYLFCDSLSNSESNVSLMVGLPIPSNPSSSKEGAGVTVNDGQRSFSTSSFKSDSKIKKIITV